MTLIHNRYKIVRKLGEGGMGAVYLTEDIITGKMLVVKIIKSALKSDNSNNATNLFKNEYDIMTRLKHPNLVTVFDYGVTIDGDNYIVMEYIDGVDLKTYINRDKVISDKQQFEIIVHLLQAIEYMHSRNIIYRDIKPENILISVDNQQLCSIKIIDFGLSDLGSAQLDSKGTIHYMSPESVARIEIDHRSDIFSLGVLFYEMETGKLIYSDISFKSVLDMLLSESSFTFHAANWLQDLKQQELKPIIKKMTAFKKEERFYSCSEIIDAINTQFELNFQIETKETALAYVLGTPFTNRKIEMDRLNNQLNEAYYGLNLITGGAGIGKSRLIEEFAKKCKLNNLHFLKGECIYTIPYNPFIEILNIIYLYDQQPEHTELIAYLKFILPSNPFLDKLSFPINVNENQIKNVLIRLIPTILLEFARKIAKPLILFFNNLHEIDDLSSQVLIELINANKNSDTLGLIFIISEYPDDESAKLNDFINKLPNDYVDKISLKPFDTPSINKYLKNTLGNQIGTSLTNNFEQLNEMIGGNPYFLQEFLKFLITNGFLVRAATCWTLTARLDAIQFPNNLKELLCIRFAKLELQEEELTICRIAALLNQQWFTIKLLLGFSDIISQGQMVELLERLVFLEFLKREEENYAYQSRIAADTVLSTLSPNEIANLHRRIAAILTKLYQADTMQLDKLKDNELSDLTFHHYKAKYSDPTEIITNVIPYLENSAKRSLAKSAFKVTVELCSRIINLEEKCAETGNPDEKSALQALTRRGAAYKGLYKFSEAEVDYLTALNKYNREEFKSAISTLKHYLSTLYYRKAEYDKSLYYIEEYKKFCEELNNPLGIAHYHVTLAMIAYSKGELAIAEKNYRTALKIAQKNDDLEVIGACYNNLGIIMSILHENDKTLKYYLKYLQICKKTENIEGQSMAAANLGVYYNSNMDFSKAMHFFKEAISSGEKIGAKYPIGVSYGNLGILYCHLGKFDEALKFCEKGLRIKELAGDLSHVAVSNSNMAYIYGNMDNYEEATKYYDLAIELAIKINSKLHLSYTYLDKADLLIRQNKSVEAQKILELIRSSLPKEMNFYFMKLEIFINYNLSSFPYPENIRELIVNCDDLIEKLGLDTEEINDTRYRLWTILHRNDSDCIFSQTISNLHKSLLTHYKSFVEKSNNFEYNKRIANLSK